jgi:hypothetical protein
LSLFAQTQRDERAERILVIQRTVRLDIHIAILDGSPSVRNSPATDRLCIHWVTTTYELDKHRLAIDEGDQGYSRAESTKDVGEGMLPSPSYGWHGQRSAEGHVKSLKTSSKEVAMRPFE